MATTVRHDIVGGFDGYCRFCGINPRDLPGPFSKVRECPPCVPHEYEEEPVYDAPAGNMEWSERDALEDEPEVPNLAGKGVRTTSA